MDEKHTGARNLGLVMKNPKTDLFAFLWKVQRRLFSGYAGRMFHQEMVDKKGNVIPLRKIFGDINQKIIEKGYTPPWLMTKNECLGFWASITNNARFAGNRPDEYAAKPSGITKLMHDFWSPEVMRGDSILELGCNCGANLNMFYQLQYSNLSGIEINKNAIEEMKNSFPELARSVTVFQGSLEEKLPQLASNSVDLIFSMAVLMHLHPSSNFVFSEMVRVAQRYIITIEPEAASAGYVFPRNYLRVFKRLGCSQLKSVVITP